MLNGSQRGFTYIAVLITMTIIGATLASAGMVWHTAQQREREAELLFVIAGTGKLALQQLLGPHQQDLVILLELGQHLQRSGDDFIRRVIASHGIHCDTHVYAASSLPSFRVRLGFT